jgi:valyl-tRNA synthetase
MRDMTDESRPTLEGLEAKWATRWQEEGTYAFDRSVGRDGVYAIDTPPPTVSGSLHIGHVYSYTHTDIIARYQRMLGMAVFYPMGFDDNGLPTERRVQNVFGVRCDPSLPYDAGFAASLPAEGLPDKPFDVGGGTSGGGNPVRSISRRNFVELCTRLTGVDEAAYERLWRHVGLSVDWSQTYTTIGTAARATAQTAFLRELGRGEAYLADAPTLWDVSFQTAVAQAELEDRERPGAYHRLRFGRSDGRTVEVDTTRPELLPACVALVCHPSDERYRDLVGDTVHTPLFNVDVPVLTHGLADPEKGTGIVMVCTFGDTTDVTWWRELNLPSRVVVGRDGRFLPSAGTELAGRTVPQARRRILELLREAGALDGEPRPITHLVKFYEKGEAPLEIVSSRQWYVRNGGRDAALRDELLADGRLLRWYPEHMRHRYEHWVGGLTGDWLVSRQRFFGVPIPVWYPLTQAGEPDYDNPLTPDESRLPVDPSSDVPDGYTEEQRNQPGGFRADPDVLDTWATSSLTPQLAAGWLRDPDLFARVYPMNLRPSSHEIIRTWLFTSVLRGRQEFGELPWRDVVISGWIMDPDRKKMSKSVGNTLTPMGLLERHGSDGVRYWAASGRPGTDLMLDEQQMKVGRRLATKLLNASRFVLGLGGADDAGAEGAAAGVDHPLDRSMLAELSTVVGAATAAFDRYDHTAALTATEDFFWRYCDDYIELVKERGYHEGGGSARAALRLALDAQLRLFAPVIPFVTEEVWSWWRPGSVHRAAWPTSADLGVEGVEPGLLTLAGNVLGQVRRAKSQRHLSMKTEVPRAEIRADPQTLALLAAARADLCAAAHIAKLDEVPDNSIDPTVVCYFD